MFTRRTFVASTAALSLASAPGAFAQDTCAVMTPDRQKALSPLDAVQLLKDGNARFIAGQTVNCDLLAQVRATAQRQSPFAAVLGCMDSRVPPELVFDQRIGSIFALRVAGNFASTDMLGSLEYATRIAGAKAILVLGHTDCGAIKGALDKAKLGNLTVTLRNIDPAIEASREVTGERSSRNKPLVRAVTEANAQIAARMIVQKSETLSGMVARNQLVVVPAVHNVATGQVTFLERTA